MIMFMVAAVAAAAAALSGPPGASEPPGPLEIMAWGTDSLRIRSGAAGRPIDRSAPGALGTTAPRVHPPPAPPQGSPVVPGHAAAPRAVVNGAISAEVAPDGRLVVSRAATGELLFAENAVRSFNSTRYPGVSSLTVSISLGENERIFGLGQVITDNLDLSGQCLDTQPSNGHIVIPLAHSSQGYSILFNLPSYGSVCIDPRGRAGRRLVWHSRGAFNFDIWVTATATAAGALAAAMQRYIEATGRPTKFPAWTAGFWQSKNRYRSTTEVLAIAREYRRLAIPLSVIVIDEGAWDLLGDEGWGGCANGSVTADGSPCPCFADAAGMTAELKKMGIEVMLSPYMQFAVEQSKNFPGGKRRRSFALGTPGAPDAGEPATIAYSGYNKANADSDRCLNSTGGNEENMYCGDSAMWDVFSDAAGAAMMDHVTSTFYSKSGIQWWWLDCDEPCDYTGRVAAGDRLLWNNGSWPDVAVGAQYPAALNRQIYKHMTAVLGRPHVVTLARSAWAGSQRWGVAVWSGDTSADWSSLRNQITEGQSAGLSGISYWASDIGGYQGLNVANGRGFDMDLLLRWFQFGAFSGIFRSHGFRGPVITDTLPCSSDTSHGSGLGLSPTSGHNEAYTFTSADHVFNYSAAIIKTIRLRDSMQEYVLRCFAEYVATGAPVMAPMFYAFPSDPICSTDAANDQFMFGRSVLVAPIYTSCSANFSCTARHVYLPRLPGGRQWTNVFSNRTIAGPANVTVDSPRDAFPLFTSVDPSEVFVGEHAPWAAPPIPPPIPPPIARRLFDGNGAGPPG